MADEAARALQQTIGVFDRAAATYDRAGPRFFSHFGRRLVDHAELSGGLRVLDVAAGRGAALFPVAERIGPTGHATGIDLSEEMIRATAKELASAGLGHAEIRRMDAEHLEFPDATFHVVLCGFALWFFPNPHDALREFMRVLKPGGRLALTTWARENPAQHLARGILRAFIPSGPVGAARPDGPQFNTPDQIAAALEQAGFERVRVFAEEKDFVYHDGEEWWATLWSMGIRNALEKLQPAVLDQVKAAGFQQLETLRRADGIHIAHRALFGLGAKPA